MKFRLILILILSISNLIFAKYSEGQYPLSEIKKLNLFQAGLIISIDEIYNPNGISLIDALVKVNGCSGSFLSDDGLIITNHHCAFAAINDASTTENNYLENGFWSGSKENEIPAKDYTAKITESYEDVSQQILESVKGIEDLSERSKAIQKKMKEIGEASTDLKNSIEASVSEMFPGQSYILFKYRIIEDVRLVYVPPRTIGEFGGEADNWVWPRHTGDFTFMRAYVASDGSSAKYDKSNIPFKPKKFLKVNENGLNEGDFAFILGYPGKTYRNFPSNFLEYQYNFQLPFISDLFEWTIDLIERTTKNDEKMSLAYSSHIKRLANTMKNYKGKIQGLQKTNLIDSKKQEEIEIQEMINSDQNLNEKYSKLFLQLEEAYKIKNNIAKKEMWLNSLGMLSDNMKLAFFVLNNAEEMEKPNSERSKDFKDENISTTIAKFDELFQISMPKMEMELLNKMIKDASFYSENSQIIALQQLKTDEQIADFVEKVISSNITNRNKFQELLKLTKSELTEMKIPILNISMELNAQIKEIKEINDNFNGTLSKLLPQFNEVKRIYKDALFIPDANGTLRFTYGYVKGYSPKDAIYSKPFTTLTGIIEKNSLGGEYQIPAKMKELYKQKDFGNYFEEDLNSVPVALLYNMDTTGGNSGSPILDENGYLVGVNFDRAFEATINDYAWSDEYSRSIGVDIRYILWVTEKIGGAEKILDELGIKK